MARNFTYDINDLYNFIDGLADISALVWVQLQNFQTVELQKKKLPVLWSIFAGMIINFTLSCRMTDSG
jgi:hypothetical protein